MDSVDNSVLDIGMIEEATEDSKEVIEDYVDFLVKNGIVTFSSNVLNGTVMYRTDILGNELAKIIISLREGEDFWAYTDLSFIEFPVKRQKSAKFKVIHGKEK